MTLAILKMDPLHKLAEYFGEFPGIGPRQAKRFAYFLMTKNSSYLEGLSNLILDIKKRIKTCSMCFRLYPDGKTTICPVCSNMNRNRETIMIISRDVDFDVIEKSSVYNGLYFILGGIIPILEENPEKKVRLKDLKDRINKSQKEGSIKEIILSLNTTAEGENTADFIRQFIITNFPNSNIKISVLGRGLSTGSELEYLDSETIKNALENRKG